MDFDAERATDCIEKQVQPEPFSGVVHLTRGNQILLAGAYGLAVRSEAVPNRVDTRFQMASGCKIFTSVAVCRLVERREATFETRLGDCVDEPFPDWDPDITLHHLLTHTSGIRSYFEEDIDPDYEALWRDRPVYGLRGPGDFLPLFRNKPMKFRPGERFDYNDGGYILLGLALEKLTGKSFPAVIRDEVFAPAGMKDSGYFPADRLPERTALAYISDPDGNWRTNVFAVPVVGGPDGGAYTTGAEMAGFWRSLTRGELLNARTTSTLLTAHVSASGTPPHTHYGYGVWIERPEKAIRKVFVEGADPGVAMRSAYYPAEDTVLTIIGNTGESVWPLYRELERVLSL